jgi:hypothetical protein
MAPHDREIMLFSGLCPAARVVTGECGLHPRAICICFSPFTAPLSKILIWKIVMA